MFCCKFLYWAADVLSRDGDVAVCLTVCRGLGGLFIPGGGRSIASVFKSGFMGQSEKPVAILAIIV